MDAINLDRNLFFQLLINPKPGYRIARHTLLWSTALILIYFGFEYIARSIPDPAGPTTVHQPVDTFLWRADHSGLPNHHLDHPTVYFTSLPIRVISGKSVFSSCIDLGLGPLALPFFTDSITLPKLPGIYARNAGHIAHLPFWQVPFDSIIVGLFSFSLVYNYLLYAVGFKVFKDLFILKIRQEKLEKENLQLEFNFLKAQVNPHFLFNTLNNIYSFSIKSPEKVPNTILKLADMMRYSLYETEAEFVPLAKELSFLNSYVQLQRIRHEEGTELTYTVQGQPGSLMIPPFLLIVFVENAFKHGLQTSTQAGWVHIALRIEYHSLFFTVENNRPGTPVSTTGGIGLKNVRKRLDLLYANRYHLAIDARPADFIVHLNIQLYEPALPGHHR